ELRRLLFRSPGRIRIWWRCRWSANGGCGSVARRAGPVITTCCSDPVAVTGAPRRRPAKARADPRSGRVCSTFVSVTAHTSPSTRVHAFTADALADHDAVSLAAALRSGELSRREVTEAAIARIRAVDPAVHGMELDCFATALADADTDLPSGPLAGVPSLIKDNADVAGMPTRHGSAAFDPHARRASS